MKNARYPHKKNCRTLPDSAKRSGTSGCELQVDRSTLFFHDITSLFLEFDLFENVIILFILFLNYFKISLRRYKINVTSQSHKCILYS